MTTWALYDTDPVEVINRAKLDAWTRNSFGGVKENVRADRNLLCSTGTPADAQPKSL